MDNRATRVRALAYVVLCVAPAVLYLGGWLHPFNVGNADMLGAPAFIDAVRTDGWAAFSHWLWPSSPYFVPDLGLYTPLWLLLPSARLAPAGFMVVQLLLVGWVARFLSRRLGDSEATRWGALVSFSLLILFAIHSVEPARFVLVSYYRAGTFMAGVGGVALLAGMVRQGEPWRGWARPALAALATAVLALSDPMLVPSAVLPAVAVVAGLMVVPARWGGWSERRRPAAGLAAGLAVASFVGLKVNGAIVSDDRPYQAHFTLAGLRHNARLLATVVYHMGPGLLLAVVVAAVILALAARREWRGRAVGPASVVLAFWLASGVSHLLSMLAAGIEPTSRYLQLVTGLPILAAGPVLAGSPTLARIVGLARPPAGREPRRMVRPALASVAALPFAAVALPAASYVPKVDLRSVPLDATCLDQALPTDAPLIGVSGYWQAREIQLYSRHERKVAAMDSVGRTYDVNTSSAWSTSPWSFAVIDTVTRGGFDPPMAWIEKLAPGAAKTTCGPYTVLVFAAPVSPNPVAQPGDALTWRGCELGSLTGTVVADRCTVEVPEGAKAGFGSFGGYTPLAAGRYEAEVRYSSDASPDTAIAVLEVTRSVQAADPDVITEVPLFGTGGRPVTVTVPFDLVEGGQRRVAEIRTRSDGTHGYQLDSTTFRLLSAHPAG